MGETGTVPPFFVLLGPDYAGKSSAMTELAAATSWRFVSVDRSFLDPAYALITRLRRQLVDDVLPALGETYSYDFAFSLLQTAVVHLRDRIVGGPPDVTTVVDSYYFKILAKCRLLVGDDHPMFAWWRSFPQPRRVLYLDVSPETAWRRSGYGAGTNRLEHYGSRPDLAAFVDFQADLGKVLLDEVGHLPVSVILERGTVTRTARDIMEVLSDEVV